MQLNPFFLNNRIPDKYFCDREKESKLLIDSILNQENVVLMAQRRIGKTGLINHCFESEKIREKYYLISIDILHTSSLKEFVQELGKVSFKSVARTSEKMMRAFSSLLRSLNTSFGYDPVMAKPTFDIQLGDINEPAWTLDEIFEFLEKADKPCIVAIDEFQQILRYPEKNIEEILRGKIQKLTNTHLIFAGSERRLMSEIFFSEKRPFYQSATSLLLYPIEKGKYSQFACEKFQENGKSITGGDVEEIYDKYEGITFHVHKILHDAYASTPEKQHCEREDLLSISRSYLSECGVRYKELLGFMSEQQKELFYAICREGKATGITSAAFLRKHKLRSASSVQSAAKALTANGHITKTGNVFTISDPLMRIWLLSEC